MKNMTRKEFLLTAAGLVGVGAALAACGGDDDPNGGGGGNAGKCSVSSITANHGHALTVGKADVDAGVDKTYDIQGSSGHPHTVTVTAADFAKLKGGTAVTITSSSDAGHTHDVSILCA